MSVIPDFDPIRFAWRVEKPVKEIPRYSPTFLVNSSKYYLYYECANFGSFHIYFKHMDTRPYIYYITVHVEHVTGLALLSSSGYVDNIESSVIWSRTQEEILKQVPCFFVDGLLKFIVTIHSRSGPYEFTSIGDTSGMHQSSSFEFISSSSKRIRVVGGTSSLHQSTSLNLVSSPGPIRTLRLRTSSSNSTRLVGLREEKSNQTPSHMDIAPCLEDLSEDLSKLVEQNSYSDVVLSCGDRTVKAHRCVLSVRSSVFSAMLQSDMAESRTGVVEIQDMDPSVFDQFVRYLYTGRLPCLTVETATCFYEAADKYAILGLARLCASFLQDYLEPQSACEMLTLADAHGDAVFKEAVMDYILQNEIFRQDEHWLPYCENQPKLAHEVTNRFFKMQSELKKNSL